MYVGVRHKDNQSKLYWFEVPSELREFVRIGSRVLCDTSRGNNPGTVVSIIDGVEMRKVELVVGCTLRHPLKKILAVKGKIDLERIHIPWELEGEFPHKDEINLRISEFCETGRFSEPVVLTHDFNLRDGYAAYLVARMFDHEKINGVLTVGERRDLTKWFI